MPKFLKRRLELEVYLNDSMNVVKVAHDDFTRDALLNEARMLKLLDGTGIAPKLLTFGSGRIVQEFIPYPSLEESVKAGNWPVEDQEKLWENTKAFLQLLQGVGVRHGDLRGPNVFILPGDKLMAIDWQQSNLLTEPESFKHKGISDRDMLLETLGFKER